MPKDKNNNQAMTKDEKFRSFFSTTAVNIPDEMTRRDEELPEEKPQKRFGLFARGKADQEKPRQQSRRKCPPVRWCWARMPSRSRKQIWN